MANGSNLKMTGRRPQTSERGGGEGRGGDGRGGRCGAVTAPRATRSRPGPAAAPTPGGDATSAFGGGMKPGRCYRQSVISPTDRIQYAPAKKSAGVLLFGGFFFSFFFFPEKAKSFIFPSIRMPRITKQEFNLTQR